MASSIEGEAARLRTDRDVFESTVGASQHAKCAYPRPPNRWALPRPDSHPEKHTADLRRPGSIHPWRSPEL